MEVWRGWCRPTCDSHSTELLHMWVKLCNQSTSYDIYSWMQHIKSTYVGRLLQDRVLWDVCLSTCTNVCGAEVVHSSSEQLRKRFCLVNPHAYADLYIRRVLFGLSPLQYIISHEIVFVAWVQMLAPLTCVCWDYVCCYCEQVFAAIQRCVSTTLSERYSVGA